MKFGYVDTAMILHITKDEATAKRCVKKVKDKSGKVIRMWNIVPTDFPAIGGYPIDEKGNIYTLYSATEERHKYAIPEELAKLYEDCAKYKDVN